MFFLAENAEGTGTLADNWWILLLLGGLMIFMFLSSFLSQRKKSKQQQQMMSSLGTGSKIMTIGGFVGTIVGVEEKYFQVDIGTPGNPQIVVIVKNAVRQSLDAPAQQAAVQEQKSENKNDDTIYAMPAPTEAQVAEMAAKEEVAEEAVVVEEVVDTKEEAVNEEVASEESIVTEEKVVEKKPATKKPAAKKPAAKKTTKK